MASFFPDSSVPANQTISFQDNTLILPALTIGNVCQLAIDLLIFTTSAPRVGFIEDRYVVPVICNDVLSVGVHGKLSTSLEVYQLAEKKVTFLQQRAPVIEGRNQNFAKDLVSWIKRSLFKEVVLLVSADASYRIDSQLVGPQFRYISTGAVDDKLRSLQWVPLEESRLDVVNKQGSFALALSEECKSNNVTQISLSIFCFEGDNIPDSVAIADSVNKYLQILPSSPEGRIAWKSPPSWAFIQGPGFERSLFQ